MNRGLQDKRIEDMMERPIPRKKVGSVHLQMVKESRTLYGMGRFTEPGRAVRMIAPLVEKADREMVMALSLNTKLEPLALEIVSVGGENACSVDYRDIFKHSILNNAAYIMCFHNHPSGDPEPSREDRMITRRLEECGTLLGIPLIDHIIVGDESRFYSLREHGEISLADKEVA